MILRAGDGSPRPPRRLPFPGLLLAAALLLAGNPTPARPPDSPPVPELPPPSADAFRLPTFVPWPSGATPAAPPGFRVERYAEGLESPRNLHVLPNGDVVVAEGRTERMGDMPPAVLKMLSERGIFGPSPDRLVLLRKTPGGVRASTLVAGLRQPFGLLWREGWLYVANTDSLVRFRWQPGEGPITTAPETVIALPAGAPNNHWTRNLLLSPDGGRIFISVGAATNINEQGDDDPGRAAIWEIRVDGSGKRLLATGLRNPVGLAVDPRTGQLWTTVNERDGLGPEVPPDYLTRVVDNGFYGWPWVYFGDYPDPVHRQKNPDKVAFARQVARVPDLALGAHSVPLGLLFLRGRAFPERYREGAFVARRGGVGRVDLLGYDVVFVPFARGRPTGAVEPFLTGFIADPATAAVRGRPVGLGELPDGSLLVADDRAGIVWRVIPPPLARDAAAALADVALEDQNGRRDSLSAYRGRPVVALVVTPARLPTVAPWAEALARRFPGLALVTIADVPANRPVDPARLAATLRRRVPAGVSVLMDLDRRYATALGLDTAAPNLLVFGPGGALEGQVRGRHSSALEEQLVALVQPLARLPGAGAPGPGS